MSTIFKPTLDQIEEFGCEHLFELLLNCKLGGAVIFPNEWGNPDPQELWDRLAGSTFSLWVLCWLLNEVKSRGLLDIFSTLRSS